jgi:hypothetical protein
MLMFIENPGWSRFVLDSLRTQVEHNLWKREIVIMWLKDAAAGASLVLFIASSFALASAMQAIIGG